MTEQIEIDKLCAELGLTSRTLRHWESQGLFTSSRNSSSGWRVYDAKAVLAIQVTAFLRSYDMGIKDIKAILADMTFQTMHQQLSQYHTLLSIKKGEAAARELALKALLHQSSTYVGQPITMNILLLLKEAMTAFLHNNPEEALPVTTQQQNHVPVRYISLPPMRFVYHIAISESPEDEAMDVVISWLEKEKLMGTARLFGGNMPPLPSKKSTSYGYGMCASIPESVQIPDHLKELRFEGGLYAMMESSDNVFSSWQSLMKHIADSSEYKSDHKSRLCLEEHIRNDSPEGSGNTYLLNLLEPVRKK